MPAGGIIKKDKLSLADTLQRCKKALDLWKTKEYEKILVTGGIFLPPNIQTKPAGDLMALWFRQNKVPAESIIIENQALDSFKNCHLGLKKLNNPISNHNILVVTQWHHAIRLGITFFLGYGIRVNLFTLKYPISIKTWFMEWLFIFYHLYDPKGKKILAKKNRQNRTY